MSDDRESLTLIDRQADAFKGIRILIRVSEVHIVHFNDFLQFCNLLYAILTQLC